MAQHQDHPYHLVNPSPMPILTAFSAFAVAVGLALFMHEHAGGGPLLVISIVALIACVYRWWRDVIHEGLVDKAHTSAVQHGLRSGMALFIVSEVMFFAAFFWAFFNSSVFPKLPLTDTWEIMVGVWPPEGIVTFDPWDIPFINTLILLLSGTTVTWAHHALLENNQRDLVRGLALTVTLGVLFSLMQAYEYHHAHFGFTDGIYASTFYLATGFHGAHVLMGTTFLAVNLVRARRGTLTPKGHLGFEFAAWYWHFVDVVWLFLFICVYWWGGA